MHSCTPIHMQGTHVHSCTHMYVLTQNTIILVPKSLISKPRISLNFSFATL